MCVTLEQNVTEEVGSNQDPVPLVLESAVHVSKETQTHIIPFRPHDKRSGISVGSNLLIH